MGRRPFKPLKGGGDAPAAAPEATAPEKLGTVPEDDPLLLA